MAKGKDLNQNNNISKFYIRFPNKIELVSCTKLWQEAAGFFVQNVVFDVAFHKMSKIKEKFPTGVQNPWTISPLLPMAKKISQGCQ